MGSAVDHRDLEYLVIAEHKHFRRGDSCRGPANIKVAQIRKRTVRTIGRYVT